MQHSPDLQALWAALSPAHRAALGARTAWLETARAEQIPAYSPEQTIWAAICGRGWGKSKAIYEETWWQAVQPEPQRIAVVAPTWSDLKKITFFGRSGLKAITPPEVLRGGAWESAFNVSDMLLTFANGTTIQGFPATEPDRLRGPEHHLAVCEELAAWPNTQDAWDMMRMGLRLGASPKTIIATTPRPTAFMRALLKRADVQVIRGRTFDNASNLPKTFLDELKARYEGTRLGRQELNAEVLEDAPGALWQRDKLDHGAIPDMARIVVAVDPSGAGGSEEEDADSIGIIVAGKGVDGRFYVIEDATCRLSPAGWGRRAVERYRAHAADLIVAERNFGGAMVESVIRTADRNAPVKLVTASRGKAIRAEPIAALYEQGRVTHAAGLEALEDQMMQMTLTGFVGEGSPDRVDALVWAMTELMGGSNYTLANI